MANHQRPKPKKVNTPTQERRCISDGQLRIKTDSGKSKIVGYAAKFIPAMSESLGGFREELDPHCFDACLAGNVDCRALWNHDPNHILGRTTSGTLRLTTDTVGLFYEIDPPDTQLARDLMTSLERKDVTASSFGFLCSSDSWREAPDGTIIRTVLKAELFDVSPVVYPAYPDATSTVRASLHSCPANLRAKLRSDDDDDDSICDPDSPDYDPDNDDCPDQDDDEDRCACRCEQCAAGTCEQCSAADCESDLCEGCPTQQRAAHMNLLLRRLRS